MNSFNTLQTIKRRIGAGRQVGGTGAQFPLKSTELLTACFTAEIVDCRTVYLINPDAGTIDVTCLTNGEDVVCTGDVDIVDRFVASGMETNLKNSI